MSVRSPASDLFPVAAVGVAILALGGLLLLIGAGTSVGDPSEFDTWLVGVGLVLLLGAMLVVLIRAGPPATKPVPPGTSSSTASSAPEAPASLPTRAAVESPATPPPASAQDLLEAAPRAAPPRAPPVFPGTTSIPAQYEGSRHEVPRSPGSELAWDEGDVGVSLPFAAGAAETRPAPVAMTSSSVSSAFAPVGLLEREVERLRERVHELERTGPSAPRAPARAAASGIGTLAPRSDGMRPPEPPSQRSIGSRRLCIGCGAGLPGGATDPLCWGCGRPLCSTCYWRAKDGSSAHTCPACFARAGTTAVSGGRGPPTAPTSVAANPRSRSATASR
ncbi:MAG: hypothetical protein L3K00_03625 [Thermoplasmata archaeon]|nr:hypothetical protein [Thermoplasmata archaeon]MCI4362015.1 hypothetical protein [Thermoplasmata archaeon]